MTPASTPNAAALQFAAGLHAPIPLCPPTPFLGALARTESTPPDRRLGGASPLHYIVPASLRLARRPRDTGPDHALAVDEKQSLRGDDRSRRGAVVPSPGHGLGRDLPLLSHGHLRATADSLGMRGLQGRRRVRACDRSARRPARGDEQGGGRQTGAVSLSFRYGMLRRRTRWRQLGHDS